MLCLLDDLEITQLKKDTKPEDYISSERGPFYYPRIFTLQRQLQNLVAGSTMMSDTPCVELDDQDTTKASCKTKSKSQECFNLPRKLENLVKGSIMTSDAPCFGSDDQGKVQMIPKICLQKLHLYCCYRINQRNS